MQSLNVLKRPPRVLSTRRPLARSTMRERSRLLWHTVVCLLSANHAWAQSQSQFQYIYDAAGSVTQITRSDVTPKPDLTISNVSVGAITANINGSYAEHSSNVSGQQHWQRDGSRDLRTTAAR